MNDAQCGEYMLEILRDYNSEHAATMMHIGQIRDELHRRSNETINEDQLINSGIYLAERGHIRIEGQKGIRGWTQAIILRSGIGFLENRDSPDVA